MHRAAAIGVFIALGVGCSSTSSKSVGAGGKGGAAGQGASGAGGSSATSGGAGASGNGGASGSAGCTCVTDPGAQWQLAVVTKDTSAPCPLGYTSGPEFSGGEEAKNNGCSCGCNALVGVTCKSQIENWATSTGCAGASNNTTDFFSCHDSLQTSGATLRSVVSTPGSCPAVAVKIASAFDKPLKVCSTTQPASLCASGVCVPATQFPFQNECVTFQGTGVAPSCPLDFPIRTELFTQLTDDRICDNSGCTCDPQVTCSGATGTLCAGINCSAAGCTTTVAQDTCQALNNQSIDFKAKGQASGSCTAGGTATFTGQVDVDESSKRVVCCASAIP